MKIFRIPKRSGTYQELLETYGLSNLLAKIFEKTDYDDYVILISDRDTFYEITTSIEITVELLRKVGYFPFFPFVKQKQDMDVTQIAKYFDYPLQKDLKKERQDLNRIARNELKGKDLEIRLREIERIYREEKPIDIELDVYTQMCTLNNYPGFSKLYDNFINNQDIFYELLCETLNYYGDENYDSKIFDKLIKKRSFATTVTAIQLYNPHQGQGVNKLKADGLNRKNFDSSWICESLKISGALSDMICQLIKIGSGYDLKVSVPEYRQVSYRFKSNLIPDFKRHLKKNTPILIDILNILSLTEMVVRYTEFAGRKRKVKNIVAGLHTVYQKDLGKNRAVTNIGFIQLPDFIEIGSKEENECWLDILEEQKKIIGNIKEDRSDAVEGLVLYRNFISGSDINSFYKFSFWYATYLMSRLSKNEYVRLFTIQTLDKFYKNMDAKDVKLSEIISNKGFQAVAEAIRKSTVVLLYAAKDSREYEIRYGVAQALQNKSKSKEDLATFIGEFIALYNAETAQKLEKNDRSYRSNVRQDEMDAFYGLLDDFSPKLVAAMLSSYGFALKAKALVKDDIDDNADLETED